MDGDCGYVAAADRVIAPVVRAALHGCCAVVVNGQQGIGCEPVRRLRDHHCWRVSDGADVRIGRYRCEFRTIRKLVSSDARRPRWSAAAWRYPPALLGRPPALPRYPPASPGCARLCVGWARLCVGCARLCVGWAWLRAWLIGGNKKSSSEELLLMGGRWDSNPRHSEPQSDALTN